MNIDEIREQARLATYPNSEVERETVQSVDSQIFDKVRIFENHAAEEAISFRDKNASLVRVAGELETSMRQEVRYGIAEGAEFNGMLAQRYDDLRNSAHDMIARLEHAARDCDWHIAKVSDPYKGYGELIGKFPMLAPTIRLQ